MPPRLETEPRDTYVKGTAPRPRLPSLHWIACPARLRRHLASHFAGRFGCASLSVSDLDSSFKNGILRSRMGAAAAHSGAPCVPTATPGPWDIPPAIGDACFIHYPNYRGCVAARLETRSAAQRADHKPDKKTAVATPAPGDSPAKGTRSQVRTTGSTGGSRACGPSSRPRSKSAPASRPGRARSRLDEINEEDEDEEEDEEDHSNLDEDSRALILVIRADNKTRADMLDLFGIAKNLSLRAVRRLLFRFWSHFFSEHHPGWGPCPPPIPRFGCLFSFFFLPRARCARTHKH